MDTWGIFIFISAGACVISAVGVLISAVKHRFSPRWGRSLLTSLGVFVCTSVVGAVASANEGEPRTTPADEPETIATEEVEVPPPPPPASEPEPVVAEAVAPPPSRALMPVIIPIPEDAKAARKVVRSIVDQSQRFAARTRSCKHRETLARAWKTLEALPTDARTSRRAQTAAKRIELKRNALLRSCNAAGLEKRVQARIDFADQLPVRKARVHGPVGDQLRVRAAGPQAQTVLATFDAAPMRAQLQDLGFSRVTISANGTHHIKELEASSDDGLGAAYLAEVGLDAPLSL